MLGFILLTVLCCTIPYVFGWLNGYYEFPALIGVRFGLGFSVCIGEKRCRPNTLRLNVIA